MATETTAQSHWTGRLPISGASKVPGPGLKIKKVRFTIGTSQYPDGGYLAADLETICGLTRISVIVPCGFFSNGSHENMFGASWDDAARTLQVVANRAQDGNALTVGTGQIGSELATDNASADGAILTCLVIGY